MYKDIEVVIRKHHFSRVLRMKIGRDGVVRVTIPLRASLRAAEDFVQGRHEWILQTLEKLREKGLITKAASRDEYRKHRKVAREIATARVLYFSPLLGVTHKKISIRNQRTRWGSCSRTGNLCFNYRIALLPPELADYLVVHELCHLREFNHSPAFWRLVGTCVQDAKACRKAMKCYLL